jgi:hypothetical protein
MKKLLTQFRSEVLKNAFSSTKGLKTFAIIGFSILFILTSAGAYLLRKEACQKQDYAWLNQTKDAPTTQTLLVSFKVDPNANSPAPFTLTSITQYNSRVDRKNDIASTYTLNITNNGDTLYSTNFNIPTYQSEGINPETKQYVSLSRSSVDAISFRIPYFNEGVGIEITNQAGQTLLADTIHNVQIVKTEKPNYTTTTGDQVPAAQTPTTN